jgi:NTE family protein
LNEGTGPGGREFRGPVGSRIPGGPALASWWAGLRGSPLRVNLALQGGGAHGAFTWGVLDGLLEDPRLQFEGLSGSSAGAMNAVVMADGWLRGGREGAREALAAFWTEVGRQVPAMMVSRADSDRIELTAATRLLAGWARRFSPSQLNPLDLNPLRSLLARRVDFGRLRAASPFKLFVGATRAASGRLRIFREHELTVDVLLASACLPRIHHAIEIDGDAYWDGGFSANPAVFPLFYECETRDVMLVLLDPLDREGTPSTVEEIETRVAEIAFSAHFMREMRMFAQARRFAGHGLMSTGRLERRLQRMRFHMIDSDGVDSLTRTDTKALAYGPFLERLRAQGRVRASGWLARHASSVGRHSTVDLDARFG